MNFNWKLMLMLALINGAAIALTAMVLPGISIPQHRFTVLLILGAGFGLLNAFVKPIVQFLTISLLFVTYGLVIIIVNTVMFILLEFFLPNLVVIDTLWWAIIGGTVVSLLGLFLENLFGLSPPIIDETAPPEQTPVEAKIENDQYQQIVAQARQLRKEVLGHENEQ